ncbi:unnamed protein product, partial [Cylicocyclus nassatus]
MKNLLKKLHKSAKKQLRNLPKSLVGPFRKGSKASALNPVTHGLFTAQKVLKGLRHGKWRKNVARLSAAQRSSDGLNLAVDGGSPSYSPQYVHNARTLSQLTGAGVTTAGALYTNKSNISATQAANNQNLSIAAMNNATQIDMANSAHQREVADLRAAGLNPLLSAGGSGSSTPTLQSATMQASHYENPVQHAVQ